MQHAKSVPHKVRNMRKSIKTVVCIVVLLAYSLFLLSFLTPIPLDFLEFPFLLDYRISTEKRSNIPVSNVIRAAKDFWHPPNGYWSRPSVVSEHDDFWWVKFSKKRFPRLDRGRFKINMKEKPGVNTITVYKSDMSCSFAGSR